MNRWIPSFKRFFVEAVYHDKAAINRSGLRDFLNDELPDDLGQFAARVLMHFCVDDSRFNGNMTAVKAVLAFLEEGLSIGADEAGDGGSSRRALCRSSAGSRSPPVGRLVVWMTWLQIERAPGGNAGRTWGLCQPIPANQITRAG